MRVHRPSRFLPALLPLIVAGCDWHGHDLQSSVTEGEALNGILAVLPEPDLRPVLETSDLRVLLQSRGSAIPDSLVGLPVRVVGTAYRGNHPGSARLVVDSIMVQDPRESVSERKGMTLRELR